MLPASSVKALECLIDEVERVPGIGKRSLGLSREQGIGEHGRRETGRDRREQSALSRLAMAHVGPTPQPAFERRRIWPASKRRTFPPRRLAVAIRRYAACAVEQGQVSVLLWQQRQKVGERDVDRETHVPAVAVLRPEQRHLPHDVHSRYFGRALAM